MVMFSAWWGYWDGNRPSPTYEPTYGAKTPGGGRASQIIPRDAVMTEVLLLRNKQVFATNFSDVTEVK
jgi:hypothetical protein